MKLQACPRCGEMDDANWPIALEDGSIAEGGCQNCWETDCAKSWWEQYPAMAALSAAILREQGIEEGTNGN